MTEETSATRLYLDEHAWATLAAAMDRVIPADETPGASDLDTIVWLDRYLSGPAYVRATPDGSGFEQMVGRELAVWEARIGRLRQTYADGVAALDDTARSAFGADFAGLDADQRDEVLRRLEAARPTRSADDGAATGDQPAQSTPRSNQKTFDETALPFFRLLLAHTRQAYFSDPVYGGNRDHRGWAAIGFVGPRSLAEVHETSQSGGGYSTDGYLAGTPTDAERA